MNPNESPKQASTPTVAEIKRQRQARLEAAITPQGSGSSGRRERYTPPPDYPLQPCDFKKWSRFDSMPIEQACFVLLSYEPPPLHVLRFRADPYDTSGEPNLTWVAPIGYEDMRRSLGLRIEHGNISAKRIREGMYETKHVTLPELVRWARSKSYTIPPELESIAAQIEAVAVATPEPQAAPMVTDSASGGVEPAKAGPVDSAPAHEPQAAGAGPRFSMTKAALIASHEHEWTSIRVDIAGAANNGLKAAKAGPRGWYEDIAMEWARAKGKRNTPVKPANELAAAVHSMASVPSRQHILKG